MVPRSFVACARRGLVRGRTLLGLGLLAMAISVTPVLATGGNVLEDMEDAWTRVLAKAEPSAVTVSAYLQDLSLRELVPGARLLPQAPFVLSGVVYDDRGHVVTVGRALGLVRSVQVELADGRRVEAEVVGVDVPTGVAVLRLQAEDLPPPAEFSDLSRLRAGAFVAVQGNAFGLGRSTVYGNVSGTGRRLPGWPGVDLLQVSAPINPGDQGGMVLDVRGQVIGLIASTFHREGPSSGGEDLVRALRSGMDALRRMLEQDGAAGAGEDEDTDMADATPRLGGSMPGHSAAGPSVPDVGALEQAIQGVDLDDLRSIGVRTEGVHFAVPADAVRRVADRILAGGPARRPWLGLKLQVSEAGNMTVTGVVAGSPAEDAGVQPGDCICALAGEPADGILDFLDVLARVGGDHEVVLIVERSGRRLGLPITPRQRP